MSTSAITAALSLPTDSTSNCIANVLMDLLQKTGVSPGIDASGSELSIIAVFAIFSNKIYKSLFFLIYLFCI